MKKKKIYVIDLFCGAGGTSTAIFESNTCIEVIACINHDKNAVLSHEANYPNCKHFIEDIRTIDLHPLISFVDNLRVEDPDCLIAIWASLECTSFSRAKCGPKNADSRTLATDLFRYLDAFDPDFLWIENVEEFLIWGPLDEKNNPIKSEKGVDFNKWKAAVLNYGFKGYWNDVLCSADYGGYTIRKRLFIQFSKKKINIGIPLPSSIGKWKPVKDVLELNNHGESIFTRPSRGKKVFVWRTHRRIYKGLEKFGNLLFGYKYYGTGGFVDMTRPCCTLTTRDRVSLVKPIQFVTNPQYGGSNRSIDKPACTIIARQDKAPLGLTTGTMGEFNFAESSDDDEWMVKIKKYCKKNNIADLLVRPLMIKEMLSIQGFPEGYKLIGTKTEQKKYIGNSVEVNVGVALFRAIANQVA